MTAILNANNTWTIEQTSLVQARHESALKLNPIAIYGASEKDKRSAGYHYGSR